MLSNYLAGIQSKVNIADTASMLSAYRVVINSINSNKVNVSDTANMLSNYLAGIQSKVNIADTATMLSSRFARDTASLSNRINLKENTANKSNATLDTSTTKFPTNYAVKTYVDNLSLGMIWQQGIELANVIGNTTSLPSTPVNLDAYIIDAPYLTFAAGDVIQYQTNQWVLIDHLIVGDRFGVAFSSSTTPSGAFAGWKNNIVTITGGTPGSFIYSNQAPANNYAVFITNDFGISNNSSFAYSSSLTQWVQISASTTHTFDFGLKTIGNSISVDTTNILTRADGQRIIDYGDAAITTKLNISDTASMLSHYANVNSIPSITSKVNYTDTASMLSNYLSGIQSKVNIADTSSMLSPYAKINAISSLTGKLNISDTANMLSPYARTVATQASIAFKVNISDTSAMLNNYYRAYSSPIFNLPAGTNIDSVVTRNPNTGALTRTTPLDLIKYANGIVASDTASMLSHYANVNAIPTITGKVNYTDTSSMLSPYARVISIPSLNGVVKYTDTSTMLSPYQRSAFAMKYSDTASMLSAYYNKNATDSKLALKVNYTDTGSMLSPYARVISIPSLSGVVKYTDTSTMLSRYQRSAFAVKYSDTATMLSRYYNRTATDSKLSLKVNYTDTSSMLNPYAKVISIPSLSGVVKYTDTSTMLSPYQRSAFAVKYSDTAAMLSAYYNITATDSKLALKVNIADTGSMLSPYARVISIPSLSGVIKYTDTSAMLSPYQRSAFAMKYSDTAAMLSRYYNITATDSKLALKVNIADTGSMLSPYARVISIPSLSGVVKYTDTSTMFSPYQRSAFAVKYSDTASMLSAYYNKNSTDSKLALKVNYTDTGSMLSPYARVISIPSLSGVVKYTDTSTVLSPYQRSAFAMKYSDTATMLSAYYNKNATDSKLALKVNYTDTSSLLSPYQRAAFAMKYSDTASMLSHYANVNTIPTITGKVNYTDTGAMLSNYYRAYSSPIFNLPAGTNIDSVVTRNPNTGALTLTTPLDLIKYANGIVATDTASMLSPYVRNNSLQTGGYLKYSDTASMLSTIANRNKLRDSLLSSANTWSLTPTFSTMKKGGLLFAGTNGLLSQDSAHLFFDNTNERLVLGAATFDATNPEALKVVSGSATSKNAIAASGTVNDFLQYNIQNLSTGVQAKSGYSSIADNGTITTGFAWMGINNSGFNYPTAYNIGTANDVSFLGSGLDMYIANANQSKSIIFSTGKATSPFFNERMRITNAGRIGIGTNAPDTSALLDLTSSSKGLLMPRVSLASLSDASTILLPATSLMVYNTNAGLTGGVGYYYNSGTTGLPSWIKFASTGAANGSAWGLTGNSSTTAGTNFIGTTDNIDLVFKRNNLSSGFIGATNTAFGNVSLPYNSSATNSSAFGYNALNANTASGISAFGYNSLAANSSGASNAAFGYSSLALNTTGASNAAFGYSSLAANTTATGNAAFGYRSLTTNTTGASNAAFGYSSLFANTTGANNNAFGYNSLLNNTTGSNNTALGYNTGLGITTGSNNTILGSNVTGLTSGLNNVIVLADGAGNKKVYVDSSGNVGINNTNPQAQLDVVSANTTNQTVINASGNINDFLQFNVQNTSTGTNAQSGYSATADNGNNTTGFVWMGINNSQFNYPTFYNVGGANDVSFLGSGQDMYVANANQTKSIIFSTGTNSAPYFNERMRITNAGFVGIGTSIPSSLLDVTGTIYAHNNDANNIALGSAGSNIGFLSNPTQNIWSLGYGTSIGTLANTVLSWNAFGRVGIGTASPDTSALLDLTSSSKGLLFPRVSLVSLSDASTILLPATSLMVYNTNAGLTGGVGYYYNSGTTGSPAWTRLSSGGSGSGWGLTGNTGTTAGTNFIGTTDNIDLLFKRNNISSGFIGATNTTLGNASLPYNSTATNSAAFGYNALNANTASGISAFGYNALAANTSGASNAAFGYNSLYLNTTGANNAAFGYSSLAASTTGSYNSAFGTNSLLNNTTGTTNAAFGYNALVSNTTGASNTAVGYNSLGANNVSGNSAFGYYALAANSSGTSNVAVGYYSLAANTTGANNAAVGYNALAINTTGSSNTAIGNQGLSSNTTGLQNTAIGNNSLSSTSTGGYNTATGASSLSNNLVGNYNSAFGYNALVSSKGNNNTSFGYNALSNNTTGNSNTAIGYNTGLGVSTGSNNTIIGSNVTGLSASLSNTIILADGAGNQRMYVNSNGQVGIGTTNPSAQLNLNGGHIKSQQSTIPTIVVATQNGITAAAISANTTDMKGNITTTGTNNGTNTALTVTFKGATFSVAPVVIITAASASAQYTLSYVQATTTGFTLYFYNFQSGANPSFNYMVIE
jgi:hypothetical protein